MNKFKYIVVVLMFVITRISNADVAIELGKVFDTINVGNNANGATAIQDQNGGYWSFGSVVARTRSRSVNPINAQLPSLNCRCGSCNIFGGALSALSLDELVDVFKTMIPQVTTYGLRLAMQTLVPQIHQVTGELQDLMQKMNALNMGACRDTEKYASGMLSKMGFAQEAICIDRALQSRAARDLAEARLLCADANTRGDVAAKGAGLLTDVLDAKFNLVWKAIRKNKFLAEDDELAEMYMTLSGSIIRGSTDAKDYPVTLPSLGLNQELVLAILYGTEGGVKAKKYKCDEPKECLNPTAADFTYKKEHALALKVENMLTSLSNKLVEQNSDPTPAEEDFVNSTMIPIQRIMTVESANRKGGSPISIFQYRDDIAYDTLLNNMDEILRVVSISVKELEKAQIDGNTIERFKQDLRDIRYQIIQKRRSIYRRIHAAQDAVDRTRHLERELFYKFNNYTKLRTR